MGQWTSNTCSGASRCAVLIIVISTDSYASSNSNNGTRIRWSGLAGGFACTTLTHTRTKSTMLRWRNCFAAMQSVKSVWNPVGHPLSVFQNKLMAENIIDSLLSLYPIQFADDFGDKLIYEEHERVWNNNPLRYSWIIALLPASVIFSSIATTFFSRACNAWSNGFPFVVVLPQFSFFLSIFSFSFTSFFFASSVSIALTESFGGISSNWQGAHTTLAKQTDAFRHVRSMVQCANVYTRR